jgi:hypothetical protein
MGKSLATSSEKAVSFQAYSLCDTSVKIPFFECNNFVDNALNKYTIEVLGNKEFKFLKQSKRTVTNIHQIELRDTIYTFSDKANKIQIYRAKHVDIIYEFDVTDTKCKLLGNVGTGMTKAEFSNKFNILKPVKNKIKIGNSNGTQAFTFYFNNNKIQRINALLYMD